VFLRQLGLILQFQYPVEGYDIPKELTFEELELLTRDGEKLQCYFLPAGQSWCSKSFKVSSLLSSLNRSQLPSFKDYSPANPRATVILFHGNGYHIWHHIHSGRHFVEIGCNALIVSYRGSVHLTFAIDKMPRRLTYSGTAIQLVNPLNPVSVKDCAGAKSC
jgi:hypothetical protein